MRVKGASSREVVCMGKGLRTSMGGVRMGEGVKIYRVLNLPDSFVNLNARKGKQNLLCLNKDNFQILQKKTEQGLVFQVGKTSTIIKISPLVSLGMIL